MNEIVEKIKQNLTDAIEECAWVVEGGDAHDLIDAVEQAHAAMAKALACIQYSERIQYRLSKGINLQCAICKYLREGVFVEADTNRKISNFECTNLSCKGNDQWEWCGIQ